MGTCRSPVKQTVNWDLGFMVNSICGMKLHILTHVQSLAKFKVTNISLTTLSLTRT